MIQSNKHLTVVHVCRDTGLQSSKITTTVPVTDNGIVGRQDIVFCRRALLTETGAERCDTLLVTNRLCDSFTYVLFSTLKLMGNIQGWNFQTFLYSGEELQKFHL